MREGDIVKLECNGDGWNFRREDFGGPVPPTSLSLKSVLFGQRYGGPISRWSFPIDEPQSSANDDGYGMGC